MNTQELGAAAVPGFERRHSVPATLVVRADLVSTDSLRDSSALRLASSKGHWASTTTPGTYYWHVKGRSNGVETDWSETRPFTVAGEPTPSRPTLLTPSDEHSFIYGTNVLLSWSGQSQEYYLELRGAINDHLDWTADTFAYTDRWSTAATGTVTWRVKGRTSGLETGWSETRSFTFGPNADPPPPTLLSPADGAALPHGMNVLLQWTGQAEEYLCEMWRGEEIHRTGWTVSTQHWCPFDTPGLVSWHVKARSGGNETEWSETRTYTIGSPPQPTPTPTPTCVTPTLVQPEDGATVIPGDQILLRWSGNCDEYLCEVWRGEETHSTDWTTSTEHWSPINTPGMVYWHVKCRCNGEETDWSDTRSYTVHDWPHCDTPELVSPPTEQDFVIPCTVNLQWTGNCAQYYVEWSRNSSYNPVEGHSAWTSQTTYPFSAPTGTTPGKVYWHIKGRTAQGVVTGWSETRNFDLIGYTPCNVPILDSPTDGATFAHDARIVLHWHGDCEEYKCEVWGATGGLSGWTRETQWVSPMPPNGGQMCWRVKGRNAAGDTPWSPWRYYTVHPRPPLCNTPQLQSPPTGQDFVIPCTVNLQWESDCAEYYVEWARNPSFSVVEGHSPWTSQTTYALDYPEGSTQGKVYWHVKGRTAEAGETNWSETRNFDLISPTPPPPCPVPTLVDPPDGATFNWDAQIDLTWNGTCEQYYCDVSWSGGGGNSGWTWEKVFRAPMPPQYEGGQVTWKVKGRNSAQVETAWSESRSYTVLPRPTPIPRPDPPVPWDPPKGRHFSRGTQVALRWNAVSGASLYALEVWKTGYYWTQAGINNVEYPTQPLNDPGLYYWHVAAKYPSSDYSDWSENWYFYID